MCTHTCAYTWHALMHICTCMHAQLTRISQCPTQDSCIKRVPRVTTDGSKFSINAELDQCNKGGSCLIQTHFHQVELTR